MCIEGVVNGSTTTCKSRSPFCRCRQLVHEFMSLRHTDRQREGYPWVDGHVSTVPLSCCFLVIDACAQPHRGFGSTMANTPMVIMWHNSDGSFTLSQRTAPGEVMPTVDSNPPRVATTDDATSAFSSSGNSNFSFTISVRVCRFSPPESVTLRSVSSH